MKQKPKIKSHQAHNAPAQKDQGSRHIQVYLSWTRDASASLTR